MSSERLAPWRAKPPQEVVDLLHSLSNSRLYLVQRTGPTSFLIREDGADVKRKVMVGSRMSCTWCVNPCTFLNLLTAMYGASLLCASR